MAGIKSAMQRVMDGKNKGYVEAMGCLKLSEQKDWRRGEKPLDGIKYIIVRLDDGGLITQYDSSDVHIHDNVKLGCESLLVVNGNWNATWADYASLGQVSSIVPQNRKKDKENKLIPF